jgi:diaminopimelate decarboxylase
MFDDYQSLFPMTSAVDAGEMSIGGVPLSELAATYGTPLYVYDEHHLKHAMRTYVESFAAYPANVHVCYACKALCCNAVVSLAAKQGLGADVASGGELAIALRAGMDAAEMVLHGNNKSREEIAAAVRAGVRFVVVDAEQELDMLAEVTSEQHAHQELLVRVNPGIDTETHRYIRTAHTGSKFGVEPELALTLLKRTSEIESLTGVGVHVHLGSQLLNLDTWRETVEWLAAYAERMRDQGTPMKVLDLGGGLGIPYTPQQHAISIEEFAKTVVDLLVETWNAHGLELPELVIEPGRSVVGRAGVTLYEVGVLKEAGDIRYVNVDGGMSDNHRPMLYQAEYTCMLANRASEPADGTWWIAGKHCESGDVLIEDAPLPHPHTGDLLVVAATGAYGASMASNYNALPKPPIVFVEDGHHRVVVRRETFEDLMTRDMA